MKYEAIMWPRLMKSLANARCGESGAPHAPPIAARRPAPFYLLQSLLVVSALLVLSQHVGQCAALPRPQRTALAVDCSVVCDDTDHSTHRPQDCDNSCVLWKQEQLKQREQLKQLEELKQQLNKTQKSVATLETRTNSLLVMVVLLAVLLLLLVPLIIYRNTFINYFFSFCCSSNYNKQQTVKKKSGRRSRRGGAPTSDPSAAPRTPDSAEQVAKSKLEDSSKDTVIANGTAVRMATLAKEQPVSSSPVRDVEPKRQRHPSESSCTAEAEPVTADPNSSFGDQSSSSHAYYNYGCSSSSTLAISPTQSRTSATSGPVMPLNASALLASSQEGTTPRPDHKQNAERKYSSSAEKYIVRDSTSRPSNSRVSFDRSMSRRPSSPESPTDGTTFSNITMATTLSSGTLTPEI